MNGGKQGARSSKVGGQRPAASGHSHAKAEVELAPDFNLGYVKLPMMVVFSGLTGGWHGNFVVGAKRHQTTLFPPCLEDWIAEDNLVRSVDAFAEALDLGALGFAGVMPRPWDDRATD